MVKNLSVVLMLGTFSIKSNRNLTTDWTEHH